MNLLVLFGLLFIFAYNNCGGDFNAQSDSASSSSSGCALADPSLRNPKSIDAVTSLINALPKPLTLPCFIENLQKPLNVFSLHSTFSAQSSESADAPRIFIINDGVLMSVVPTGVGKEELELSTYVDSERSVKAEIAFPVLNELPFSAPFDTIRSNGQTSCRFCHIGETQVSGYSGIAYSSPILRPNPFVRLSSVTLRQKALNCNSILDPYRCEIMKAVFVSGRAQDTVFP